MCSVDQVGGCPSVNASWVMGRKEVVHKREQELNGKMQKLRAEGMSYRKIAEVLNTWGMPTKTRKGRGSGMALAL